MTRWWPIVMLGFAGAVSACGAPVPPTSAPLEDAREIDAPAECLRAVRALLFDAKVRLYREGAYDAYRKVEVSDEDYRRLWWCLRTLPEQSWQSTGEPQ